MPARLRCCCYSIAIAWMTIIATSHALAPPEDFRSLVVEKNRRTIGSLFAADASDAENVARVERRRRALSGFFLDGIATTAASKYSANGVNGETKRKSLLRISSPEIFQDSDSLFDSDSNAPHVRVKRIANSIDTPTPSNEKSPFSYRDRRRNPQKIFKRFAIEETNPADENEAEYSNFNEGNVDVPGNAFLDDEISRKRNHLEDVYPEVTDLPKTDESRAKRSNVADRRKRDRLHRDADNEEEYDYVDCVDDEDSYYDDQTEDRQTDSRSDNYEEEEEEDKEQKMNERTSASKASESKSDRESGLSESGRNSKIVDDEEQLVALKRKSSSASTSSKKSYKDTQTKEKTKPKKKPADGKSKDDQKKRANVSKDKSKSESKQSKNKAKPKPTDKRKDKKRAKPTSKSKSSKKVEKNTAPAVHKVATESIANVNSNDDGDDKCAEEEEDNAVEEIDDRERLKRNKSILVKAIPRGDSVKELQIFQRADGPKKKTDKSDKKSTTVAPNKIQSETTLGKSDKYIGEVKDLLGRLIVKVDDLHSLVSEMRSSKVDRQELVDEKITRSNFPVDRRRPGPCSFRRSSSSSSVLWSPWTRWSSCSVSCGRGSQTRDRRCLGGCDHQLNTESQTRVCHLSECPPTKFLGIF